MNSSPNAAAMYELESTRKKLDYFIALKSKSPSNRSPIAKWIEIYTERMRKLERQSQKSGLRTELKGGRSGSLSA